MHIVRFDASTTSPITLFESTGAHSRTVAVGAGDARTHVVVFEPGGVIGPHEATFGQLFVPVVGSGWIAGPNGERVALAVGAAGYVARDEVHSKGSDVGMTALMVQVRDLDLVPVQDD